MINKDSIKEIDNLFNELEFNNVKPVTDGIIDISQYEKAKFKILWILKEANSEEGGWDLKGFIANNLIGYHNWRRTYKMIIYTTWGILNDFPKWEKRSRNWEEENISILRKTAIINLKKIPGPSVSSDRVIKEQFQENKSIIFKQIDTYNPDIIIFGGTMKYLHPKDLEKINAKKSKIIISAYHPNARKNHQSYYENLIKAVQDQII